jgi:uncharacterized protein YdhG (YjbR/CyaY superfamily)
METEQTKPKTIDEYLSAVPENIREILEKLRETIHSAAPSAKEVISYGMPAFKINSVLVYFAVAKNHIGFYPTTSPIVVFKDDLAEYKTSKGAIQFPMDKPLPFDLIRKIVEYRVIEDSMKAKKKSSQTAKTIKKSS